MVPSTHVEVPSEPEAKKTSTVETLVLKPRSATEKKFPQSERNTFQKAKVRNEEIRKAEGRKVEDGSFQSSLLEYNRMKSTSRLLDVAVSLLVNVAVLSAPILAGLYFTDTINLKQLETTFLVAPPPPPPPPPAPAAVAVARALPTRRVFEQGGRLIAPTVIPRAIALVKEAPLPPDMEGGGVAGGVPGGVAGGSMGGVIGGVIGGVSTKVTLPPPLVPAKEVKPRAPVRVGGHVKEPRLVRRVEPNYPALARQVHLQGVVGIEAIVDEQGNVVELKVVSGPPLLIQAAMDAVRQWKYEPTYLNEQPVAVQLNVTVTFRLNE